MTRFLLQTIVQIQKQTGWRLLFLSNDDALCRKYIAIHALQSVSRIAVCRGTAYLFVWAKTIQKGGPRYTHEW